MRRRRRIVSDHDNHDRWLISYADFITLLFAFFVVMYAVSAVNENKYRVLANALGNAFGNPKPVVQAVVRTPVKPERKASNLERQQALEEQTHMKEVARSLMDVMAPLMKTGKVRVTQSRRGVSIEINANVLFQPGHATLEPGSLPVLRAVAATLKNEPFKLEITGHTDDTPIRNSLFASNWELSSVRASSVVRLLANSGIAASRLYAIGREASEPLKSNETVEGRARNRRVEMMVLSALPDAVREIPVHESAGKALERK